jgi:hypothetical protein
MLRYVLSLTFAVSFAPAATISTTATCDGVTTVGTTSATCDDGQFRATATVSSTHASVFVQPSSPIGSGEAFANFSADYVLTVFPFVPGTLGGGLFFPCFSGGGSPNATAEGSFGGITVVLGEPSCPFVGTLPQPFTFGVPQIVHYSIEARVMPFPAPTLPGGGDANFSFNGILLSDLSSCATFGCSHGFPPIPYPYTLVEVSEPSALSLLVVGLMFFVVVAVGGRRCPRRVSSSRASFGFPPSVHPVPDAGCVRAETHTKSL